MKELATIYSALDAKTQTVAKKAAAHISSIQQRLVADIVEIGRTLQQVKEAVGHGNFLPWLRAEFNWTDRTAQNFMSVAERFGSNPNLVSNLPLKTVYSLAAPSVPDDVRSQIVERLKGGEVLAPDAIASEIAEARKVLRRQAEEEKKLARKKPEEREKARKALERSRARQEAEATRWRAEKERRQEAKQQALEMICSRFNAGELATLAELLEGEYLSGGSFRDAAPGRAELSIVSSEA